MLERVVLKALTLLTVGLGLSSVSHAVPQNFSGNGVLQERRKTIAHLLLELESKAQPIEDSQVGLLDRLLGSMLDRLPADTRANARTDAKAASIVLRIVDNTLLQNNFVFPPQGLVDTFGDALVPHTVGASEFEMIARKSANQRRSQEIKNNRNRVFYYTDGKTTAIFYLAIAELLGIEMHMVEVPGGNFVRWIGPAVQINWDTNQAVPVPDEAYVALAQIPANLVAGKVYLASMSEDELLGYWHGLVADRLALLKKYEPALMEYEAAVHLYKSSPEQKNNLAWFLATCPEGKYRDPSRAIVLAKEATSVWLNPNWIDTLAAAYAEAGQWEDAVAAESQAKDLAATVGRSAFYSDPWPDYRIYIQAYREHKTYAALEAAVHKEQADARLAATSEHDSPTEPTACASDPTYRYLESLQRKEYLKNPVAKRLLADLVAVEKSIDEVSEELSKRPNTLKDDSTISAKDNAFIKDKLRLRPPTCYENRLVYALIDNYVREVDAARQRLKLPLEAPPKYGSLPIPAVNAATIPATDSTEDIVVFNTELFSFDYQMTKVVLPTIQISEDKARQKVIVSVSREAAERAIRERPDTNVNFVMALLEFLQLVSPSTQPLDQAYDPLVITFTEGMELFAVAHEYAHVIKKHRSPKTTLSLMEGRDYVAPDDASTPVLMRSWEQEFEADDLGLRILIEALRRPSSGQGESELRWLYSLYGARFFFKCMELVDKAKYISDRGEFPKDLTPSEKQYIRLLASGKATEAQKRQFSGVAVDESHPPAWYRQERLDSAIEKYLSETTVADDARAFAQIGTALLSNIDVLWDNAVPRLPLVISTVRAETAKNRTGGPQESPRN